MDPGIVQYVSCIYRPGVGGFRFVRNRISPHTKVLYLGVGVNEPQVAETEVFHGPGGGADICVTLRENEYYGEVLHEARISAQEDDCQWLSEIL